MIKIKGSGLWTRNFTLAIIGMVISAAGGVGLNVAMTVLVFKETSSTALSAIFGAISMIPHFVLPLVVGPLVDRRNPLKVLVSNELILAALFFAAAAVAYFVGFNYWIFMVFSLIISSLGVVSQLASGSVLPQIMKREHLVKGNAAISVIYPLCGVAITPLAMLLYNKYGFALMLLIYAIATMLDALIESGIKADFEYIEAEKTTITDYFADLKDGLAYLKNDRAILSVFLCFTLVLFAGTSSSVLVYPFFEKSQVLTDDSFALMRSISSLGYLAGGFLHYFIKIPDTKRYRIAVTVYFAFILCDSLFFFMPFWLMCATRFILGILGMNSANIRGSAVQVRVPNIYRAKVNAFFGILVTAAEFIGQLIAGALGEFLPYPYIQIGFQVFYLAGILIFILPRKNKVRELYNYSTAEDQASVAAAAEVPG